MIGATLRPRRFPRAGAANPDRAQVEEKLAARGTARPRCASQRMLAGLGAHAAAGECGHAGGMMGAAAERPLRRQRAVADFAGDGSDHRDFRSSDGDSGGNIEGSRAASIDLPAPGDPMHKEMMPPAAAISSARFALSWPLMSRNQQIGFLRVHLRLRARQHLRAFKVVGDLDQRMRGHDLDVPARPGRLRAAGSRTDQPLLARVRPDRRRQHARDGRDRAVEPEFAEHGKAAQRVRWNGADRRHQPQRNGEMM